MSYYRRKTASKMSAKGASIIRQTNRLGCFDSVVGFGTLAGRKFVDYWTGALLVQPRFRNTLRFYFKNVL